MRRPRALGAQDVIALVAPSGRYAMERVREAEAGIAADGWRARRMLPASFGKSADYLAGPDARRAATFERAWKDPKLAMLWAVRGGFGAARTLDHLKAARLRKADPKILAGYSDITALLNWTAQELGTICFHAPNAAGLYSGDAATKRSFKKIVTGEIGKGGELARGLKAAHAGKAEGRLAGGNLIVLSSLVGTPYEVDLAGKVLFVEDINEAPYCLDRAVTQLVQASNFAKIRALLLGTFTGPGNKRLAAKKILPLFAERLPKKTPVLYGLKVGHVGTNLTMPIGARVRVDSRSGALTLLENVVR
ncbi:MAG: LD-carboxypeptidase [Chrysiogenetes bacterium]|nr:LD-carboxypeptidase [Chrysiogenetes bacterium]